MTTDASQVTCPNCSRKIETGFKFCDFCGTKLDAATPEPTPEPTTQPEPAAPEPTAPVEPTTTQRPPGITSRPMKAGDLRSENRAVGFGGRLRWQDETTETSKAEDITPPPPPPAPTEDVTTSWRRVDAEGPSRLRTILAFALHVAVAFIAGAVLLAIAAVVASMTSDGRVALLEVRGLPIFIAGATSIIVFSLLRTGPRSDRRNVALSVVAGFVILVGAVALIYRPSLMADAQRDLDARLGVFGPEAEDAVEKFEGDVAQWNLEVDNYRVDLVAVTNVQRKEPDENKRAAALNEFKIAASGVEAALEANQKRMVAHAESIQQAPLRDALTDLADIFDDELASIRVLTRGFVTNDQSLIKAGDTGFKEATARAVEFFDERVKPILERAEIPTDALAGEVAELTKSG